MPSVPEAVSNSVSRPRRAPWKSASATRIICSCSDSVRVSSRRLLSSCSRCRSATCWPSSACVRPSRSSTARRSVMSMQAPRMRTARSPGPDDVHAQHQPALAAVGHGQAHLALVAGGAFAQLARDHARAPRARPRAACAPSRPPAATAPSRGVDAAQQRQRRRQVDGRVARSRSKMPMPVSSPASTRRCSAADARALVTRMRAPDGGQQHAEQRVDQQREVVGGGRPPTSGPAAAATAARWRSRRR